MILTETNKQQVATSANVFALVAAVAVAATTAVANRLESIILLAVVTILLRFLLIWLDYFELVETLEMAPILCLHSQIQAEVSSARRPATELRCK